MLRDRDLQRKWGVPVAYKQIGKKVGNTKSVWSQRFAKEINHQTVLAASTKIRGKESLVTETEICKGNGESPLFSVLLLAASTKTVWNT